MDAFVSIRCISLPPHVTIPWKVQVDPTDQQSGYLGPSPDSKSRILPFHCGFAACPGQPTLNKAPRPYIGNPAPASPEVVPCLARYSPDESRRRSMPSRFGLVPELCPDCRPTQQTLTNQWSLRFRPCQPLIGGRTAAVRFLMGQWVGSHWPKRA